MRFDIQNKENCCGCTACENICAHNAISMVQDIEGFLYPKVDATKCVDCGLCVKVCQFNNNYERYQNYDFPIIYGGRQKDKNEIAKSQTAGLAALIYEQFLSESGDAYGVTFNSNNDVIFACAKSPKEAQQFRGSKYVQANIGRTFSQIKESLKGGNRVLFIGSPCQVAGLKSYIPNKLHEKLFTVDLICHSNTSPGLWRNYVQYLEKKYKSKIIKADFRNKRFGWHKCFETYLFSNGKEVVTRSYDHLFFSNLSIRPSCTRCPYTNLRRIGDITIGDYWGWENNHTEWNDNLGVNLILINSPKGSVFLKSIEDKLSLIQTNADDCLQPQLMTPVRRNPLGKRFFEDYKEKGISFILYKYGDLNYILRFKQCISTIKRKLLHL